MTNTNTNTNDATSVGRSGPPGKNVKVKARLARYRTRSAVARDFARGLRKKSTKAEKRMWRLLPSPQKTRPLKRPVPLCSLYAPQKTCPFMLCLFAKDLSLYAFNPALCSAKDLSLYALHVPLCSLPQKTCPFMLLYAFNPGQLGL